jgi:hypothetical protein
MPISVVSLTITSINSHSYIHEGTQHILLNVNIQLQYCGTMQPTLKCKQHGYMQKPLIEI